MKLTTSWATALCLSVFTLLHLPACDNRPPTQQPQAPAITPAATIKTFEFEKNLGWVHGNCLAIRNSALAKDTPVTLITLDGQQTTTVSQIDSTGSAESGCLPLLDDRVKQNTMNGRVFYQLNLPQSDTDLLAIGILTASLPVHGETKVFKFDLDGDGQNDTVSSCDTSEGIRFSLWSGAVNTGKLLWSDYYYLGYDLQPTCPP
ncbi:MAG TPA: hypothetical protein VIM41_09295 [Gammaproteobacteria bacterium]